MRARAAPPRPPWLLSRPGLASSLRACLPRFSGHVRLGTLTPEWNDWALAELFQEEEVLFRQR